MGVWSQTTFAIGYQIMLFFFCNNRLFFALGWPKFLKFALSLNLRYFGYEVTVAELSGPLSPTAFFVNATPVLNVIRLIYDLSNDTSLN